MDSSIVGFAASVGVTVVCVEERPLIVSLPRPVLWPGPFLFSLLVSPPCLIDHFYHFVRALASLGIW
jgi:hypothetical protein